MEKAKILYKLKSLEKAIIRAIIKEVDVSNVSCLTPTQMQIIGYIIEKKDVYQKDLEDVLNLRRATVSGVLQTMEKNNLIRREISNNDGRSRKILLNNNTKNIYLKNRERLDIVENIIKRDIGNNDLMIFSNVIEKMNNNLNEYVGKERKYK